MRAPFVKSPMSAWRAERSDANFDCSLGGTRSLSADGRRPSRTIRNFVRLAGCVNLLEESLMPLPPSGLGRRWPSKRRTGIVQRLEGQLGGVLSDPPPNAPAMPPLDVLDDGLHLRRRRHRRLFVVVRRVAP